MKVIKLRRNDICLVADCELPATVVASGRSERWPVGVYCDTHGEQAEDDDHPEYVDVCPNCNCHFGVN